MALTIQYSPGTYFSTQGDLIFTVVDIVKASDPITYPDYKYICDIYVSSILVARLKSVPRPDNKIGIFNIANIVRNYIAANFNPANSLLAQTLGDTEFSISVIIKFGEEYGFTTYADLLTDSARVYFNSYNGRLLGTLTNLSAYAGKAATVRPTNTPVYSGAKHCFIPYFNTGTSSLTVNAKSYNAAGTLLITITLVTNPTVTNTIYLFDVGPTVLLALNAAFFNNADYYTLDFNGANTYRFNTKCESTYEVFTMHFLNRFGGFESRDFTKVSRKVLDIEKHDFGKLGYDMDVSGVLTYKSTNGVYNETRSVYSSQYKEKLTLNTDLLTDAEYTWMADLILSPMVFIEMDSYFLPVALAANNYEFKKNINDELTNLTINLEFGEQFNAQYR